MNTRMCSARCRRVSRYCPRLLVAGLDDPCVESDPMTPACARRAGGTAVVEGHRVRLMFIGRIE